MLIKKDPDTIKSYLEDSSNIKDGYASEVAIPADEGELVEALKAAGAKKAPVTISGGGTNTTGSRVPFGGIVISMEKFKSVIGVSVKDSTATVRAGALVDDLKTAAEKEGLFYASHPTENMAFVGGTIATNASGARSFKYGPTRKHVKRLRMVLAGGEVLDIRRGERFLKKGDSAVKLSGGGEIVIPVPGYRMPNVKNSAGYFAKDGMDLIDLFIGQEGTLSVVTEAEIGLVKKPFGIFSAFVFFKKEEDAWNFAESSRSLGALSIEYFDNNALKLLSEKAPNVPPDAACAIFFEDEVSGGDDDRVMKKWVELISEYGISPDEAWGAAGENDVERFNEFRRSIPEAVNDIVRKSGFRKLSTDIAVPREKFSEMAGYYKNAFKEREVRHVIFGHIGECHLHVNLLPESEAQMAVAGQLALSFVKKGVSLGGTVSAEHGIGKTKHRYLEMMYGRQGVLEMAGIKKAIDPHWILGLDNIFPRDILASL